jgi:AraC family ethanolamine operon transcriptional activator
LRVIPPRIHLEWVLSPGPKGDAISPNPFRAERATSVRELIGSGAQTGSSSTRPVSADLVSEDVEHLAELLRPWPRSFVQIDRGSLHAELSFTWLGPVSLFRERIDTGLAVNGTPLAGTRSFTVVTGAEPPPVFCGRPIVGGEIAVTQPRQEWHSRWPGRLAFVNTVVDVDALAECAERMRMPDPSRDLREIAALSAPRLAAQLVRLHQRALRDRSALVAPNLRHMLATEVLVRIVEGVAREDDVSSHLPPSATRGWALARALACLRDGTPECPTVPDLCDAARVSARTLEYAFRERFGVTPVRFLKLRRLNAAHVALRRASPDDSVSSIAVRCGFGDFGHFARDYHALFGQLPSETLRGGQPAGSGPRLVHVAAASSADFS